MRTIFTPSFADESDTNAQNLTVKEVVARLDPELFHVTLLNYDTPDPRIAARPNTRIVQWSKRGNTVRLLSRLLQRPPNIYFFPREGPLDAGFIHLRRWLRTPTALVTYVVSGGELEHGNPRPGLARNIREADRVVGNSTYMTRLLNEQMGVSALTVHDGIDRRYFFPPMQTRQCRGRVRVLFAGSFRAYKRPDMIVKQAARWPEALFRMAGRGEEEPRCRQMAVDMGCKNLSFIGHLTPKELGQEMREADVFLFPSILEGHPQVLGQAAASGLPVIAMAGYHPDFVINGETGFLVDSDDELQQKLELLLNQPDLRSRMGEAAILHAQQFEWGTVTALWQNVFEAVIAARQGY